MGDAIINAFKGLGFWRISLLVLLLLATAAAVYGVYLWVGREDSDALEEDQQIVAVAEGNLVNQVSISGSLLFPTRETLKFGSAGVVEELRVEEGNYVEAGQVIAALDLETLATLQEDIVDAEVKIQDAEEAIEDLLNPHTDLDVVLAEEKIVKSLVALRDAEDALDDLLTPPDLDDEFAKAELDVEKARLDVVKAEDALTKLLSSADPHDVEKAQTKIDSVEVSLKNALQDQDLLKDDWKAKLDAANNAVNDALSDYKSNVIRYLGAEISAEDSLLSPNAMLADWGTDLETLFTPPSNAGSFLEDQFENFQEDPDTPWSELTVQGWAVFFVNSVIPVCGEDDILAPMQTCVSRELDGAWEPLDEARATLDNQEAQYESALAKSEANIDSIEQSLTDAQTALGDLFDEPESLDVETALMNIALAEQSLYDAEAKVEDLEEQLAERPEPIDVEAAKQAIVSAQASLIQAEEDWEAMFDPTDRLQLALRESQLVSAQLALEAAEDKLESAVIVAPWSGLVASVSVSRGDEVNRNAAIVEIVDPLDVEVDGIIDEIDVLSIQVGDQAVVSMDALPAETLAGVVSTIGAGATNQQGVVTYPARVRMTVPSELNLIEGLSAVAEVVIQQERGLLIPLQAVMGRFDSPIVQVMEDGRIQQRAVTLGISDDFWVIVASGLVEGEQVVFQAPESSGFDFGGFGPGGGARMIRFEGGGPRP